MIATIIKFFPFAEKLINFFMPGPEDKVPYSTRLCMLIIVGLMALSAFLTTAYISQNSLIMVLQTESKNYSEKFTTSSTKLDETIAKNEKLIKDIATLQKQLHDFELVNNRLELELKNLTSKVDSYEKKLEGLGKTKSRVDWDINL